MASNVRGRCCSLEKEKQAKGEDSAMQPLLAGTQHRDLDHELGVATDGALTRLLDAKDPEEEIIAQLSVKYEHGERIGPSQPVEKAWRCCCEGKSRRGRCEWAAK